MSRPRCPNLDDKSNATVMLVGYESRQLYNIGKNSYYHQGVPGLECRTGARLVSPAKGGAKNFGPSLTGPQNADLKGLE